MVDVVYVRGKGQLAVIDLNHFMLYVMKEADENVKEFFRNAYAHHLYTTLSPLTP